MKLIGEYCIYLSYNKLQFVKIFFIMISNSDTMDTSIFIEEENQLQIQKV